jgi:threonine synthase
MADAPSSRPDPGIGWLGSPPGATWPRPEDPPAGDANPFITFRTLLWSHHTAMAAGWSDDRYVEMVRRLDAAVADVDGRGFHTTPYRHLSALGDAVGQTGGIWAKDETGNVSGSHKARHLFGLALHLEVNGVPSTTPLAIASCGNAALAAATVARAAGRPLAVQVPTWADEGVLERLDDLGADVRVCERRDGEAGDPCLHRFREMVADGAIAFCCQGTENLLTLDGGRTLGFELAAQWAAHGRSPARLLVQVGGGALASSTVQALDDVVTRGGPTTRPRLVAVQHEGCAPLARAFNRVASVDDRMAALALPDATSDDGSAMWPWTDPTSVATGLLDDVVYDWRALVHDMLLGPTPGGPVVATEADVVEAYALVMAHTGVPADPTGTAGLAGLLAARRDGCIDPDEEVVILLTGVDRS